MGGASGTERARELPVGTVTFLFTDVEGSTALLRAVGQERYGETLAAQREVIGRAVEEHGGVVVDSHGDSLFAAFQSARGAVAAAAAAQRVLDGPEWVGKPPLSVRMGLHSGEAVSTSGDYLGLPVHRGKRVCDAAHGGQVLLSAATRELVSDDLPKGLAIHDLGLAELAGFEGDERLFHLVVEGLPVDFPPPRAGRAARRALLERDTELEALEAATAGASRGLGCLVAIEGAAGIGKSRLLAEARASAAARGFAVLVSRGSELERSFPFGVVRQLFEPALARMTPEERALATAGAGSLAAPLLGGAADAERSADPSGFGLLHGLYWLTMNLAEQRPLLLTIDDLHWADAASLRWIAYLALRLEGVSVLVVAALRPPAEGAVPALTELLGDAATTLVRPAPLSEAAVAAIVGESVSTDALPEVAAASYEATNGNPLLIHQLVNELASLRSTGEAEDLVRVVHRIAPEVVGQRVSRDLARLGPEATALGKSVAILGDEASLANAAELAGLEIGQARTAAVQLAGAEILQPGRALAFAHPLIGRAVYELIPGPERDAEHERASVLLRERGAPPEQLAAQLLLTPPSGRTEVVGQLRIAAQRALGEGVPESAAEYLQRALDEPPTDAERVEVLLELSSALGKLGDPTTVERLREAFALLDDAHRRAEARLELARVLFSRLEEREAITEVEAALEEVGDRDSELRRTLEAEYLASALRIPALYEEAHRRLAALEIGAAEDESARVLLALKATAGAVAGVDRDKVVAEAERSLSHGIPAVATTWAAWGAVSALMKADCFDSALAAVDATIADARRHGAVYVFAGASVVRAAINQLRGALIEAEADARTAVDALPSRGELIAPLAFGTLGHLLVDRGMLDEAAAALRDAGADGVLPETFGAASLLHARALYRLAVGELDTAASDILACGRVFDSVGFTNPATHWRSDAAAVLIAAGDTAKAVSLAREELALARRWGAPSTLGRALRTLGLAKGGKEGLTLLRESLTALEHSPARLEHARSLVELGAALRRAGTNVEARDHLREGFELAGQCGAAPLAERAYTELLAAGAKPRTRALSGVDALTPSERRTAGMAAQGITNREIAQALFVTQRTVEMHLSNAFRKLGIGSRTQLADVLPETHVQDAISV
jgi:class 3 adenylate cyclase/DNA-binding CsgD family transcriptional regulator